VALFQRKSREYMAMPVQKPRARSDDLVIEELDDELLIYDSTNKRGHCLSATAARVWRACDGHSDLSALSEALELNAEVVRQALDELEALELLDTQGVKVVQVGSGNGNGLTRRQLAGRSARVGAGLAAAPLIYSINTSSAMALQTPTNRACALFSTFSCGVSSGAGAVAGCCCCCQAGGDCKVGGATNTCTSVTCPFGGGMGSCSSSCNPTGNPACSAVVGGTCCDVAATGPAGRSGCGCAFSANGNTCGSTGASRPAGCAANCTPGALNCGPGCCNAATCTSAVGGSTTNNAGCSGCEPGTANCQPCCNGVLVNPLTANFGCCAGVSGGSNTCPPLVT
jgi:hypothetical protein